MVAQTKTGYITPEEYLLREHAAETKSEYVDGEIVAMSGASPEHSAITFNLNMRLGACLAGTACRGFSSDLRIRVPICNRFYYPDLSVVCGEPRYAMIVGLRSLLNPTLLVEVLSDSTEATDRGEKFACYRTLTSLTTYILVAQDRPRIEVYRRPKEGEDADWRPDIVTGLDAVIRLAEVGCELKLADVYSLVDFSENNSAD